MNISDPELIDLSFIAADGVSRCLLLVVAVTLTIFKYIVIGAILLVHKIKNRKQPKNKLYD